MANAVLGFRMNSTHPLKLRLAVYGGILTGFFAILLGLGWRLEWDVHSGRERRIIEAWGIPLSSSGPRDTIISQWRNAGDGDALWVEVASGPLHGLPGEASSRVIGCFDLLSCKLLHAEWKQAYAAWVLDELGASRSISRVADHCQRSVRILLGDHQPLNRERLEQAWTSTDALPPAAGG